MGPATTTEAAVEGGEKENNLAKGLPERRGLARVALTASTIANLVLRALVMNRVVAFAVEIVAVVCGLVSVTRSARWPRVPPPVGVDATGLESQAALRMTVGDRPSRFDARTHRGIARGPPQPRSANIDGRGAGIDPTTGNDHANARSRERRSTNARRHC